MVLLAAGIARFIAGKRTLRVPCLVVAVVGALCGVAAVANARPFIYFTQYEDAPSDVGSIVRLPIGVQGLSYREPTTVVEGGRGQLWPGEPMSITVNRHGIYWAMWSDYGGPDSIGHATLDGRRLDVRFVPQVQADDLVSDARHLYWLERTPWPDETFVGRAGLDGRHINRRFVRLPGSATALAIGDEWLYFATDAPDAAFSSIGRVGLDGKRLNRQLFVVPDAARNIAVSRTHLWVAGTALWRAQLDGGKPRRLLSGVSFLGGGMPVLGRNLYWQYANNNRCCSGGGVARFSVDGNNLKAPYIPVGGNGIAIGPGPSRHRPQASRKVGS